MEKRNIYMTLEELAPILSESGYMCFGHGTGRTGNSDEVVNSIFERGLRTKDNSLYFTTVGLSTPTPEMIKYHEQLNIEKPSISTLQSQFNNWSHADSKKIIIARIPTEYINELADRSDIGGERYGAFMIEDMDQNGNVTSYLNPKFIIGCYDVEKQSVKMNNTFERVLSESSLKELREKYKKVLEKTQTRLKNAELQSALNSILSNTPTSQTYDDGLPDFDDNLDWGFEEENTTGKKL